LSLEDAQESIEPGQDWEVVIDFQPSAPFDVQSYFDDLDRMGTSIQVGEGDGMYRMHIHVADKNEFEPIEYTRKLGTITNISIENLMIQVEDQSARRGLQHLRLAQVEPGEIGVVVVAPGAGIARIFASLGAAAIIEGGQTMNPSTKEILNAFENLPTDKIIILPNNKNIVMAAKQAAEMTVKKVAVVPSVSIPQGISALLTLEPERELESMTSTMISALNEVRSGSLTIATRSVEIEGVYCSEGQVIGLLDGKLAVSGDDLGDSLIEMIGLTEPEQAELVTLYYGEDLSAKQANALTDRVRETWPHLEVELVEGGQPHYYLILSVE
jgi:dihydroxyacetone kinase-like predicted kinase